MLITLIIRHGFRSLLILLLHFIEYFLEFVKVLAAPCLQFGVVSVRKLWRVSIVIWCIPALHAFLLLQHLLSNASPWVCICAEKLVNEICKVFFGWKDYTTSWNRVSFWGALSFISLIDVRIYLDSFEKAYRPPSILSSFFVLEGKSKLVFIIIWPGDNGVTLSAKIVQTMHKASMQKDLFWLILIQMVPVRVSTVWTLSIVLARHYRVDDLVHHIRQGHLLINTVLRDDLNVVFFFVFR